MGGEVDYRGVVYTDLFNGLFVYHNERVGARGGEDIKIMGEMDNKN